MKHLEDTPWWICDEGDYNFCAYVDTDSNYFNAEPLLKHLYPNFEEMGEEEKDDVLEQVALKYQDIITGYYDELARDCFNVQEHRLEMKTECTIRSGFFSGKRRYAQYITKKEGIEVEDINVGIASGDSKDNTIGSITGSDDSKDVTSASVSYAVASGVTAILGYTSLEASDEGAATDDGSAWYIGANMSF